MLFPTHVLLVGVALATGRKTRREPVLSPWWERRLAKAVKSSEFDIAKRLVLPPLPRLVATQVPVPPLLVLPELPRRLVRPAQPRLPVG